MDLFPHAHPNYIESLYEEYLENPSSMEEGWRKFFQYHSDLPVEQSEKFSHIQKEIKVLNLIFAYRRRGHLFTTNPVRERRDYTVPCNTQKSKKRQKKGKELLSGSFFFLNSNKVFGS